MADITLVNLNMLFVRYSEHCERELHLPLGCLYLTTVLEQAGYQVDFRDYQRCPGDPFDLEGFLQFMADPAPVVGLSCMANLLPFTLLAARKLKERYPEVTVVLGGVGAKAVEREILERFDWIDLVAHGEGERAVVRLLEALQNGRDFSRVPGLFFRTDDGGVAVTSPPERIQPLDTIGRPAYHRVELGAYDAYGMVSSRGCPYECSFCSVAPVWNHRCVLRSTEDVVAEMQELHREVGVELFLFQDEFFVSSKATVMRFCERLRQSRLPIYWKAFARIDLADQEMMESMARAGCVEIRCGEPDPAQAPHPAGARLLHPSQPRAERSRLLRRPLAARLSRTGRRWRALRRPVRGTSG